MKTQIIVLGITAVVLIIYFMWSRYIKKSGPGRAATRPSPNYLPEKEVPNDKLVIVSNITSMEIDRILTGFCNSYNKERYRSLPRLYKLNDSQFAVTFPYDIEFTIFCYFLNYVRYPMGFEKSFDVTGWTTTKSGETWITEKSAGKRVMLFVPAGDTEYDNVYLTTDDNIGYKLGFALREEKQLLDFPEKSFVKPQIEIGALAPKEFKDYK